MMLQNVTLSAEKVLIERARQRAEAQNSTLNAEFRRWLAQYTEYPQTAADLAAIMDHLGYAQAGNVFTRDELNER
jgi:hypothetical protein